MTSGTIKKSLVAVSILYLVSIGFADPAPDATTRPAAYNAQNPNAPDVKAVQAILSKLITAAVLDKNDDGVWSSLSGSGSDQRPGNRSADVTAAIEQFREDFRAKYGQDFSMADRDAIVFADPNMRLEKSNDPTQAGHIAVILPKNSDAAEVHIDLVNAGRDKPDWKLIVPNPTAGQMHDRLLLQLTRLHDNQASWPTDLTQSYGYVAHQILAAFAVG